MKDLVRPQMAANRKLTTVLRWLLLFHLSLILCPIRYHAPTRATVDNSWLFALNHAAAHQLHFGQDIAWTWGPLAYLLAPFNVGNNLAHGLVFQLCLWALAIAVLWDVLVADRFSFPRVLLFWFFVTLSSINYWREEYPGYLLPPLALMLLVQFRLRGGQLRLVAALILIGLMPLFQFVGILVGAAVIGGFVLDRLWLIGVGAMKECALAILLPVAVSLIGGRVLLGSFQNMALYWRSSRELAVGYGLAMSLPGKRSNTLLVLAAFLLLVFVLSLLFYLERQISFFLTMIIGGPAFFELRHGLVRQDPPHVTQVLCMLALCFALIAMAAPLKHRLVPAFASAGSILLFFCWFFGTAAGRIPQTLASLSGSKTPDLVWEVLHFNSLRRSLHEIAKQNAAEFGLDPAMRNVVGQEPVAFLSHLYSSALGDDLNLKLPPVLQNYSAYTPYLDGLNAQWIESRGPRFLVYEAIDMDDRTAWTDAPATWRATYRWYTTRVIGPRYVLLERRAKPRFGGLRLISSQVVPLEQAIYMPQSEQPVFWSLQCSLNISGKLRVLAFRVPAVWMKVTLKNGVNRPFRVVLPVLNARLMGNYLPVGLLQFAQVFDDPPNPSFPLRESFQFSGQGLASYQRSCQVQFFVPTP